MEIHKLLSNDVDEVADFDIPSPANNTSTSTSSSKPPSFSHHAFPSISTPQQHHPTTHLMSDEMWIKIFAFLPPQVLCNVGLVCSEWQRLACDSTLSHLFFTSIFCCSLFACLPAFVIFIQRDNRLAASAIHTFAVVS